ncbi:CBO0543 family protein [Virgibacillus sp. YIM 98842]|uniref:CBO0543 family protein n=1 Tax=Virgibacillus sp. YIM 98842 TaxID=2663533 RepID=UPI0013DAF6AD|nr:CBO0543 family protein [Virgibacillus sp. YIM 98842]
MQEKQREQLDNIRSIRQQLTELEIEYWQSFSDFAAWQSWLVIAMIVVPLLILFFTIDKRKALLIGFFGFNYHVWFMYTNTLGEKLGLWEYPYQILPFLPSFALDASLVPIVFMLFYQWTLNHSKNVYVYAIVLSAILAFVFKPILVAIDFFQMYEWVDYFFLFITYYGFFLISILITNLFRWLKKKA